MQKIFGNASLNPPEASNTTEPDALPRKVRMLYTLASFLIFFGLLVGAEIIVRSTLPKITTLQFFTGSVLHDKVAVLHGQQIFEGDALLGWRLKPDLRNTFWDFTTLSTNGQGIRYGENIREKPEHALRIISLGDSITFGYRVPTTFPNDFLNPDPAQVPYTALLEQHLKKANPDKTIEVIPLAVPGYSTYQGLQWLERDIRLLEPDIVTILFGWNDTELRNLPDREALPNGWLAYRSRDIVSQSQTLIHLAGVLHAARSATPPPDHPLTPRVSKEDYIKNILAINTLAARHGARVVIIAPVYMDLQSNGGAGVRISEYRSALEEATVKSGIPYLKIESLTEHGYPENLVLFDEPIHPNYLGHQLIADQLFGFMSEKGILTDIPKPKTVSP